jgi:hypothetical protein
MALEWARNQDILNYVQIMQTPMWIISSYNQMRSLEIQYGPESKKDIMKVQE